MGGSKEGGEDEDGKDRGVDVGEGAGPGSGTRQGSPGMRRGEALEVEGAAVIASVLGFLRGRFRCALGEEGRSTYHDRPRRAVETVRGAVDWNPSLGAFAAGADA